MKPYYEIKPDIKNIIIGLKREIPGVRELQF